MLAKINSLRSLATHSLATMLFIAGWGECMSAPPQTVESMSVSRKAALGRRLFFDTDLSADGTISCGSCHKADAAFSDGRTVPVGIGRVTGTRNTPSLLGVARNPELFWDGRSGSLEEQALKPFFNPTEHGLVDEAQLLALIEANSNYRAEFQAAFALGGNQIQAKHVAQAIAEFERTLASSESDFDRDRLSASAKRGLQLFVGRAQCSACHYAEGQHPRFSDDRFHARGVGLNAIVASLPELTADVESNRKAGGAVDSLLARRPDLSQLGRYLVTGNPRDIGAWRTPSLRNVALTAPYMHDGSIASLDEAVDHELYLNIDQRGRRIVLMPAERADLVEFLRSLTGTDHMNEVTLLERARTRTSDTPSR
jgi:cytochrome c peroxidase